MLALLAQNEQRSCEQVIVIIRIAEMTNLSVAKLGLIKRKIFETTGRFLGKPFLKGIIVSNFSFVEQQFLAKLVSA